MSEMTESQPEPSWANPNLTDTERFARWMIASGFATGHGDCVLDLLRELDWQLAERIGSLSKVGLIPRLAAGTGPK